MSDARTIIDYAMDDNAKEMREALYASIYDRVTQAFEQKRIEVAGSLLGLPLSTESVETDEEIIDEEKDEKDEGHEDEAEDRAMCKDIADKEAKKEVKKHEKNMHHGKED